MLTVLKRWLLPAGPATRELQIGICRGLRMEIDFAHQTRLYLGLYETEVNHHLRRLCPTGTRCFDIGGQYGYDALVMAKLSGGEVLSVDCDPAAVERMTMNFQANPDLAGRLTARQAHVEADGSGDGVTLDDLARETFVPNLVKIDIEGGEAEALHGARWLLSCRRPAWIVETHSAELERRCLRVLDDNGYDARIVNQRWWLADHRPIEHNRWLVAY